MDHPCKMPIKCPWSLCSPWLWVLPVMVVLGLQRCVLWRYWAPKPPHWCTCTASCKAFSPMFCRISATVIPVTCNSNHGGRLAQAGLLLGGGKDVKGYLFPIQPLSQWKSKGGGWAGHPRCPLPAARAHSVQHWRGKGKKCVFPGTCAGRNYLLSTPAMFSWCPEC